MDPGHRMDEFPHDPLQDGPGAGDKPCTSAGLQVLLASSLVAVGILLVLPLVLLLSLAVAGSLLTVTATVLSKTGGLAPSTFHQGMIAALVMVAVATAAHFISRPWLKRYRAPDHPEDENAEGRDGPVVLFLRYPLPLLWVVLVLVGGPLVWLEWGGNATVPDVVTAAPVLMAFIAGSLLMIAVLVLVPFRALRRVFITCRRRPFLAGVVSGGGAVVLALVLGLGWLVSGILDSGTDTGTKEAGPAWTLSNVPARTIQPSLSVAGTGQKSSTDEGLESTRKLFSAAAALGGDLLGVADSCPLVDREHLLQQCFLDLGTKTEEHPSEVQKVTWSIRRQFRLSESDAMDATMNALVSVCQTHSKTPYGEVGAALMKAAKNKAIDLYNKRRQKPPPVPDPLERQCILWPTDELRLRSEVRVVQRAFDALKPEEQEAIVLWANGYTRKEIAEKLDVPFQRSCDLVNNTMKKLRKIVRERCKKAP